MSAIDPTEPTSSHDAPIAREGRPRWVRRLLSTLPVLSVLVFLGVWQIVGQHIDPILLATPWEVIKAFGDLISDGQLGPAFRTSMVDLGVGYGLAIVVGILVGTAMGRSPIFERVMNPYVNFFQATPLIALVPLIVIWFGVGLEARIAVTFILAVWSIIINTATGVKRTPPALIDVSRVYKYNRWQLITRVALPNAIPDIFAGLRIALGKGLIGVIIAQMEVSVTGLGGLVINYGNSFKTAYLLAAVFTSSLVGVIAAAILEIVRRLVFPWTKSMELGHA